MTSTLPHDQSHQDKASSGVVGWIKRTLLRYLTRDAHITAIETLSPQFRLIDLAGDSLKGVAWTPGQKIQLLADADIVTRTYTPMVWDTERGTTRLLAYMHGEGPASQWASAARIGDVCQFVGPRSSLDLAAMSQPVILFGDETSFGIAASISGRWKADATFVFEVTSAAQSRPVLDAIGLERAIMIERQPQEAHLASLVAEIGQRANADEHFVLTGKASSIQYISRSLKAHGVGTARLRTKAYWATGKKGLD